LTGFGAGYTASPKGSAHFLTTRLDALLFGASPLPPLMGSQ